MKRADVPKWKRRLAERHDPRKWRHSASKGHTKFAVIEQRVLDRLLALSDDAVRVYCTLALFANAKGGLAYPSMRTLQRALGGVPYHTDFASGRTRVGLTKGQRATRAKQIGGFNVRTDEAVDELCRARLIIRNDGVRKMNSDLSVTFLSDDGSERKLRTLNHRHAFFIILRALYDTGAFGLWVGHRERGFSPLSGLELRVARGNRNGTGFGNRNAPTRVS